MDFEHGFAIVRELGEGKDGGFLPFAALTAIHYMHRLSAYLVFIALGLLARRLLALPERTPAACRFAWTLLGCAAWQLGSGLSNVVLGWPLVGAVAHTAGAAFLVGVLTALLTRVHAAERAPQAHAVRAAPARLAA
jgi:cytochrome c oxidase assembly protein subunit 15